MDIKRMIIGGVILVITAVFVWYVYTNYISTKKNYEKIYNKYYNKKFMMDNKNSDPNRITRQMIADLLPQTKYKLKFCDSSKDALADSPINVLIQAFGIVSTTKYSEDFDKYELGSLSLISKWEMVSRIINLQKSEENKQLIEYVEQTLSRDKFSYLDEITKNREEGIEGNKIAGRYISKEDALKEIREMNRLNC